MHNEIQIALEFLVSFLHNKIPKSKICSFSRHLTTHLVDHFQGHWYPDRPQKGSAFRCLTLGKSKMDDVVKRACNDAGLDPDQLRETLTSDVSIWVDPDEVSYRIGEGGPVKTLINFAATSSPSPHNGSTPPAVGEGGYYTPLSGPPGLPPPAGYDYQDYSINGGPGGEEVFAPAPVSAEGLVTYHQAAPSPQQHYYSAHKQQQLGFRQHHVARHQGGMGPPPPYLSALTPPPPFQPHHYTSGQGGPKFAGGSAGPHAKYHHHQPNVYHHFTGRNFKRGGGPKLSSNSPPFYQHPAPRGGSAATRRGITFSPPNPSTGCYFNDSSSPDDFYPIHHHGFSQQHQLQHQTTSPSFPTSQFYDKQAPLSSSSSQTVYFNTAPPPVGSSKGAASAFSEDFYRDNDNTHNTRAQSQASPTYNYGDHTYGPGINDAAHSEGSNANSASPPSSAPSSFDLRNNGLNNGLDIITNNLQQLLVAN